MSNKRITDLTELTTPTTDDVFPVVDIATNTTTKVQLGNLPVPSSVTTALATKQNTLVSGTNIKTVNSNSLLGSGDIAVQETLVSGTNIKTINSTSLLGSGNITIAANPSGVSGAIQFSDGSAFASDAANLFWNNTTKRLGIGTNAPITALHIVGQTTFSDNALFSADFKSIGRDLNNSSIRFSSASSEIRANISTGGQFHVYNAGSGTSRFGVSSGGQTTISGGGSTSATTSLLVQNSGGTTAFQVKDNLQVDFGGIVRLTNGDVYVNLTSPSSDAFATGVFGSLNFYVRADGRTKGNRILAEDINGVGTLDNSAILQANSTTKGFLPPRMTTTQKTNISSPAAGLVVYDSTTNKLCCYNGSTWNDLF